MNANTNRFADTGTYQDPRYPKIAWRHVPAMTRERKYSVATELITIRENHRGHDSPLAARRSFAFVNVTVHLREDSLSRCRPSLLRNGEIWNFDIPSKDEKPRREGAERRRCTGCILKEFRGVYTHLCLLLNNVHEIRICWKFDIQFYVASS